MQLNKTKSKIRRSLGGGGLNNIRVRQCVNAIGPALDGTDSWFQKWLSLVFQEVTNAKNLISRNEPNFNNQAYTLTHEITRVYNRSHRNHHPKNEPNTNPIRTQYEPNSNPIRTQYEPNTDPIQTQFQHTKKGDSRNRRL